MTYRPRACTKPWLRLSASLDKGVLWLQVMGNNLHGFRIQGVGDHHHFVVRETVDTHGRQRAPEQCGALVRGDDDAEVGRSHVAFF
jgi:hypothetical protein